MIIKNRFPIFGWVFMSIWMSFLAVMTYAFIRDGGFHQFDIQMEFAIILGFWIFGMGGTSYFFSQPTTKLHILGEKIELTEFWLFKKETHVLKKIDIKDIYIKTHLDSDGDSFELILQTQKKEFSIKQSSVKEDIEELQKRLSSML